MTKGGRGHRQIGQREEGGIDRTKGGRGHRQLGKMERKGT